MTHGAAEPFPASKTALQLLAMIVVVGLLLFVPAGTLAWPLGWWFLAVMAGALLVSVIFMWRVNPEIFAARQRIGDGTKAWDWAIIPVLMLALVAILPVAALDNARFQWAAVPLPVILLGYVLFIAGFTLMAWAQAVNRFFEPSVRIQNDRGHHVVDNGPYAVIRHPGYVSGDLLALGMALALGSYWALLPAAAVIVILVVRTALEDRTLHQELEGYAAYAERVRYRLVPGLW